MGKGSNSTTTNSSSTATSSPDSNAYQAYLSLLNRAAGVANTPYQGYAGEQVAPINAQQTAGIGNINQAQDFLESQQTPLSAADIQRYMDPNTQAVIDATQRDFDVQNQRALSSVSGNAAAQGALGGDREAVARVLTQESQERAQNPVIAGLRSQAYNNAVQTAAGQQQQMRQAGIAAMQGAQSQVGAGTLQQQTQQAQDTQNRFDYYQQQGYPFQVAQWLAAIDTGVGSQMGGTSTNVGTGTTQGPTPNTWSQVVGGGLALAGLFSDRRVKENIQKIGETNDGQPIYRFNYKGHPQTVIGLMHDEVEDAHPEAAGKVAGVGVVDYRKATEDAVERFRGGKVAGFAMGGMPWSEGQSWVPVASGITAGRGAPQTPSLITPKAPEQQGGLSKDAMKGIGAIGKGIGGLDWGGAWDAGIGNLSGDSWGGGSFLGGDAYGGSASNPLPGLDASDYGMGRGGRVRRYANGGYAFGGGPDDDATFDGRFMAAYPTLSAGVGSSRPAFGVVARRDDVVNPDEPFRMPSREAVDDWRKGVDRDTAMGLTSPEKEPNPTELPPEVISGRSKRAIPATEEAADGPSEAMGYSGRPRLISGVAAPASTPEGAPDESFLGRLGIKMTPELKSGLLMAGLSMMANRHGGPGSFLASLGEAGQAGVGAYNQTVQSALDQAEKVRKEAFEREKFEAPFSRKTLAQQEAERHNRAQEAKEFKPTYGVIRKEIDPDTGFQREIYGWIDPNSKAVIEAPNQRAAAAQVGSPVPSSEQGVDYVKNPPRIEKGADVPEPRGLAGKSAASLKSDAEYYVQTGKLPPVRAGQSPVAVMQQSYRNAVQNYGNAVAESRGINPSQLSEMWRTAPGTLRFVLGADGRATVSLGTAVRHLDTLQNLADAWGASDVRIVNKAKAALASQFGNEAATNLEAAGRIVGPEIVKAIGVAGAGTAEERKAVEKAFSTAATPDQMRGAIKTTQALLGGQLEGRKRQAAAAGVSEQKFKELIGDRPYEILTNAEKGHKASGEGQPKEGERKQFKQGWGVFKNGKWVPE